MKNTMPSIIKTKTTEYLVHNVNTNCCIFGRENHCYARYIWYNCTKHFIDGDIVNVLQTNRGNKVSCSSCAEKFKKELGT